jgi:tRNA 5-methylaminomethyl-2-thiouridine biosynthesis bifunctional protein
MPAQAEWQSQCNEFMKQADLSWRDGQPFSEQFDDVYFSRDQGVAETEHVFIAANDLPQAWQGRKTFCIGETGFGSGLNFVITVQHWLQTSAPDARLYFYSLEKFPFSQTDLQRALAVYPRFESIVNELLQVYPPAIRGLHRRNLFNGRVVLMLIFDDVSTGLAQLDQAMDAWYLDGFAPNRNPQMWNEQVFAQLARLSAERTTLATYTSAGFVRRGLAEQGFAMQKMPGYGRKRDMLRGRMTQPPASVLTPPWYRVPQTDTQQKSITILGAGIAGVTSAWVLAQRGWQVRLIDQLAAPAMAASGNPLGVVMPRLSLQSGAEGDFHLAAFALAVQQLNRLAAHYPELDWQPAGVAQLASSQRIVRHMRDGDFDEQLVQCIDAEHLAEHSGLDLQQDALWFPLAGYLDPRQLCELLLDDAGERVKFIGNSVIDRIDYQPGAWRLYDAQDQLVDSNAVLLLANGHQLGQFTQTRWLAPQPVRGQLSYLAAAEPLAELRCPICYEGYLLPARHGRQVIGASFHPDDDSIELTDDDHQHNLQALQQWLRPVAIDTPVQGGRAAVRAATADRLPLLGGVADVDEFLNSYADLARGRPMSEYPPGGYQPGLYVNVGHGARGLSTAWLAAEIIAAEIEQQPTPVYAQVRDALQPARFLIRALKKGRSIPL